MYNYYVVMECGIIMSINEFIVLNEVLIGKKFLIKQLQNFKLGWVLDGHTKL
jgi:hypothetical protein